MFQLLIIVVPIGLFVAAYFTTSRERYLNRMEFFVRIVVLLVVGTGVVLLTSSQSVDATLGALILLCVGLLIGYFNLRFQIMRLQDLRWSPFFALLAYVPVGNLIFLLVLLLLPGKPKVNAEVFS
ncbi:DUF805 domain-containing protein [uncultured Roseibium sp.]|uniref:DUF805 domain-containing protein n=1 Tax=uncultured Roseibium sp. TaxID=1936171 RepID=UPI002617D6F8|nr:DUF805 domain-containing protein [uncultured Roseibium sp.]